MGAFRCCYDDFAFFRRIFPELGVAEFAICSTRFSVRALEGESAARTMSRSPTVPPPAPGYGWPATTRNGSDGGTSVVASPDGSTVFVTGSAWRPGSGHDYLTMAYGAATGTKLWLTRYNGPANSETAPSRRP